MDTFTNKSFQANGVSSGVVGKAKKTQEPQLTGGEKKYKKNKKTKNVSQFRNLEAKSQSCQTSAEEVGFTGQ